MDNLAHIIVSVGRTQKYFREYGIRHGCKNIGYLTVGCRVYTCSHCSSKISEHEVPNVNHCPNCGAKFDKVVVDPFADGCVKLLNDLKEERSEVPNKINGNEQLLNSAIEKVDNTIKDIENTLEAWKRGEEDNSLFYQVEKIEQMIAEIQDKPIDKCVSLVV